MKTLLQSLDVALPIAYFFAFVPFAIDFAKEKEASPGRGRTLLYFVLVLHVVYFALRSWYFGYVPFGSKAEFVALVGFGIVASFCLTEKKGEGGRSGVFFVACGWILQCIASIFMPYDSKHSLLQENPVYGVHVFFLVVGITALAVGAAYSGMYQLLNRQLKKRKLGLFFRNLPPLRNLKRLSQTSTVWGVALLGLGLGLGYLVAAALPVPIDLWDPKFLISDVVWFGYLGGIIYVQRRGMSGHRLSMLTIFWFAIFVVSMAASHSFQR